MNLREAELILERNECGETVYEHEYIDALEVVIAHLEKQVSYWKAEVLSARTALKYSQMYSRNSLGDWRKKNG